MWNCEYYQELLKETEVGQHADNDKNWYLLPNPNKILSNKIHDYFIIKIIIQ